ncbi:hypothetical protein OFC46_27740 [Escherichia coli]|nr:hypothetical protein [Escherichia coli]
MRKMGQLTTFSSQPAPHGFGQTHPLLLINSIGEESASIGDVESWK